LYMILLTELHARGYIYWLTKLRSWNVNLLIYPE
jgi:hypothetical protein